MKPLKMKGIPQKVDYEDMLLFEQVKFGVTYETMLKKAKHPEVEKHLTYLKELALNETRYHLMTVVEKTGEKMGLDYRESVLHFDELFKKLHPKKLFFTQALVGEDSFVNMLEVKKILLSVLKEQAA